MQSTAAIGLGAFLHLESASPIMTMTTCFVRLGYCQEPYTCTAGATSTASQHYTVCELCQWGLLFADAELGCTPEPAGPAPHCDLPGCASAGSMQGVWHPHCPLDALLGIQVRHAVERSLDCPTIWSSWMHWHCVQAECKASPQCLAQGKDL